MAWVAGQRSVVADSNPFRRYKRTAKRPQMQAPLLCPLDAPEAPRGSKGVFLGDSGSRAFWGGSGGPRNCGRGSLRDDKWVALRRG